MFHIEQSSAVRKGDKYDVYEFAKEYNKYANINKLSKRMSILGDPEYCYKFAHDIQGADIALLQDAIIKSGDAEYCYKFACPN